MTHDEAVEVLRAELFFRGPTARDALDFLVAEVERLQDRLDHYASEEYYDEMEAEVERLRVVLARTQEDVAEANRQLDPWKGRG